MLHFKWHSCISYIPESLRERCSLTLSAMTVKDWNIQEKTLSAPDVSCRVFSDNSPIPKTAVWWFCCSSGENVFVNERREVAAQLELSSVRMTVIASVLMICLFCLFLFPMLPPSLPPSPSLSLHRTLDQHMRARRKTKWKCVESECFRSFCQTHRKQQREAEEARSLCVCVCVWSECWLSP